jgi:hypothetical protein
MGTMLPLGGRNGKLFYNNFQEPLTMNGNTAHASDDCPSRGARKLTGDNLKVVCAELSALS